MAEQSKVLFIGGRSGVGKTRVALELPCYLSARKLKHCVIEGDNLDLAYPTPWKHGHKLAEQNLGALWANYRALDYRRVIYTNTVSVLETQTLRIRLKTIKEEKGWVKLKCEQTAIPNRLTR